MGPAKPGASAATSRGACLRRALLAAWVAVVTVLVLRGMLRAPEMSVCTFVREQFGAACEEHLATTDDGYQLILTRIPHPGQPPVLLLPGTADSAATWVISGPDDSLAGVLHNANFDVWLLERRGRAPWRHERYNGQDLEFWDFSFDEVIAFDIPALVAYIRRFTNYQIASLIGHSEGGMTAIAAVAASKELALHVQSVVGLAAPLTSWGFGQNFLPHIPDVVVRNLHPAVPLGFTRLAMTGLCAHFPGVCWNVICLFVGCSDPDNFDPEMVSRIASYYPRETSLKNIKHLVQCDRAGRLQHYDYGREENIRRYDSPFPTEYSLDGLTTPTALFYGTKDRMVPLESHNSTLEFFPEGTVAVSNFSLPFGHTDFVWAPEARELVYEPIVDFVRSTL